jgi:immunoglobulin I-set domain protein
VWLLRFRPGVIKILMVVAFCIANAACQSGGGGSVPPSVTAPSIATQPQSQSVTVGQTATFSAAANGTAPLAFQWQKNMANITMNANSATYTTPAAQASDDGATFRVVVTNSAGSATSNAATLSVTAASTKPSITTQPANQSAAVNGTATFTVVASGTAPLTYQWIEGTTNIPNSNSPSFTTAPVTAGDNGQTFKVTVSNSAGSVTSNPATLTVTSVSTGSANVLTYHNDNARTGQNLNETTLTTANVKSASFGKIGFFSTLEGSATVALVDAEPLYVSNLTVAGASHNVLFVATEHDTVFAFDADSGAQLWKTSLLGTNETSSDSRGCSQVLPEIGITSTPVIDLKAGTHGTIFAVAMSKNGSTYFQRLHALDLTTGAEETGSPTTIQATFPLPGHAGQVATFDPKQYKERSALLLLNGVIYTTWASHCDDGPYQGWIMGYSESTLQQTSVLNITPNGSLGAFWGAGAGPAADSDGNFYVLSGNGTFDDTLNADMFPVDSDFGNGFLKISTTGNVLAVADYFNMHDTDTETSQDMDLGSGGPVVLPDMTDSMGNTWHLAVGAGKDQRIYVVNRDMMGKFNTSNDNAIYQELDGALPAGVWSTSAYFNNTIYYGPQTGTLRSFTFSNAKLSTNFSSQSATGFPYPGATPSISANGTSNAILWAMENDGSTGVLHAYDATNLATELYNSNQAASGRDQYSTNGNCKFVTPVIANGKVFLPTATGVVVFGLLSP